MKDQNGKDRGGLPFVLAAVALLALFCYFSFNYVQAGKSLDSISLKDGASLNSRNITVTFDNPGMLKPVKMLLDGRNVTDRIRYSEGKGTLELPGLPQGEHRLIAGVSDGPNFITLLPREKFINFEIDLTPPRIALKSPDSDLISTNEVMVIGDSEPRSNVVINVNGAIYRTSTLKSGQFVQKIIVSDEVNKIFVRVTDRAGNFTTISTKVIQDKFPPQITARSPEPLQVIDTPRPTLCARITDTGSGITECYFEVDGSEVNGRFDPDAGTLSAELPGLEEGMYEVRVIARDRAGWQAEKKWRFIVDSTEELGANSLRTGARGQDVAAVQKLLVKQGFLDKKGVTGIYDTPTTLAVMEAQKKRRLPSSGITDRNTLMAISNKINIYLNEYALYLISPEDKVIKKYSVAIGSPYYPTPAGSYYVREKIDHPTWMPPPSPWARGAKPHPPGPGNPLGTRWIGLNSDILGIHGTPSSWSIGTAASHGCIRMHIWEVEELFEMVNVGTPVNIFPARPATHQKYKANPEINKNTTSAMIN
jgi:lipoprotein-anchoring transpeptidase ErfK/SrfK